MKKCIFVLSLLFIVIGMMQAVLAETDDYVLSVEGKPLPKAYFEDIAKLAQQSGNYENWSLDAKQKMLLSMKANGLISDSVAAELSAATAEEIDAFMLARYGLEEAPEDMSSIGLTRIAWVELGPYTDWCNDTWVWYSHMMFDMGLWNETDDVDKYEQPGPEAITPEEAIAIAKKHLLSEGTLTAEQLDKARINWLYFTQACDVKQEQLTYLVDVKTEDGHSHYVSLTPQGAVK